MSYGVLKFKLPEETGEFKEAQRAGDYLACMCEFAQWLRSQVKHGDRESIPVQAIQDKFWDICRDHNVDPYGEAV